MPYDRGKRSHERDKRERLAQWNHNLYLRLPADIRDRVTYYNNTLIYTAVVSLGKKCIFYSTVNRWRFHEKWYTGDMNSFVAWLQGVWSGVQ